MCVLYHHVQPQEKSLPVRVIKKKDVSINMIEFYLSKQGGDEHRCSKLAVLHTCCTVSAVLPYTAEQGLKRKWKDKKVAENTTAF